jgi:hypothetical protein
MIDHPTLADQRAAHLDVGDGEHAGTYGLTMADYIRLAWRELASGRIAEPQLSTRRARRRKRGQPDR